MASGKVHAACSVALGALSFGGVMGTLGDAKIGAACALGCLAGIFLTPDLDQETRSRSEGILIRASLGLGYGWLVLWYPYAKLIKHRSPLSHFPIVGTLGRLLYLALWGCIPAYLGFHFRSPPPQIWLLLEWAVAGLALSDLGHYIFDLKWRF